MDTNILLDVIPMTIYTKLRKARYVLPQHRETNVWIVENVGMIR